MFIVSVDVGKCCVALSELRMSSSLWTSGPTARATAVLQAIDVEVVDEAIETAAAQSVPVAVVERSLPFSGGIPVLTTEDTTEKPRSLPYSPNYVADTNGPGLPYWTPSAENHSVGNSLPYTVSTSGNVDLTHGDDGIPPRFVAGNWIVPEFSKWDWVVWVVGTLVTVGVFAALIWVVSVFAFLDAEGHVKPFKGFCYTEKQMNNHLCFVAVGFFARGVFCLGELTMGFFCFGQLSIGLAVALGQVAAGCGYTVAQIAVGSKVHVAQLGLALYEANHVQLAFQSIVCFRPNKSNLDAPFRPIKNCSCSNS